MISPSRKQQLKNVWIWYVPGIAQRHCGQNIMSKERKERGKVKKSIGNFGVPVDIKNF